MTLSSTQPSRRGRRRPRVGSGRASGQRRARASGLGGSASGDGSPRRDPRGAEVTQQGGSILHRHPQPSGERGAETRGAATRMSTAIAARECCRRPPTARRAGPAAFQVHQLLQLVGRLGGRCAQEHRHPEVRRPSVSGPRVAAPISGTGAQQPVICPNRKCAAACRRALAAGLVAVVTEPRGQSDGGGKQRVPCPARNSACPRRTAPSRSKSGTTSHWRSASAWRAATRNSRPPTAAVPTFR